VKKLSPKKKWWLKRLAVGLWLCLLFPAVQITVVAFIHPPTTAPMSLRWLAGRFHSTYAANQYHWVGITNVTENFLASVWISEDRNFFEHSGFDWEQIRMARAQAKASGKPARGASTITQQCARSLFLWQGRSWSRKGLEAYYTVWMELLLSKQEILELYVNVIELGDGIYGIEAAAHAYFGVSADKLTREQAALLVAILPNPKQWNPLQPNERVLQRKATILERAEFARLPVGLKP
jgi:monofunctional glycosyltransferase